MEVGRLIRGTRLATRLLLHVHSSWRTARRRDVGLLRRDGPLTLSSAACYRPL